MARPKMANLLKINLLLGLCLLFSVPLVSQNKDATLAVYAWEPLLYNDVNNPGPLAKLVSGSLEAAGYRVTIVGLSFARVLEKLYSGEVDLSPGISITNERKEKLLFSTPVMYLRMGFVFKKDRIEYRSLSDFATLTGGVMRGTFWEKMLADNGLKYETVIEQDQNIQKLINDRIDYACLPDIIAFYLLQANGEDVSKYQFGLYRLDPQPVGISKATKKKGLAADFERGFLIFKQTKEYQDIMNNMKLK
jgi:ABC-type amino acid transport substrate-binding protein